MLNPLLATDAYKLGHVFQFPDGTEKVYSNMTARKSRINGANYIVLFNVQGGIAKIQESFQKGFFDRDIEEVITEYKRIVENYVGPLRSYDHIRKLHAEGYLPVEIKALPEGTKVPIGVPFLTITNTVDHAYWLPNFLETILSAHLWQPITSATISSRYRGVLDWYANQTSDMPEFVDWQGHDFSFRGMSSLESAEVSGAAHLLYFRGTDTIPALCYLENYYDADVTQELVGGSVCATEHSIMSLGGFDNEIETFKRLITEVYPSGIVSIVSDTWNLWTVLARYMPDLKHIIMDRDGKVVIRPDSGDPADILCGDPNAPEGTPAYKGVIQMLWEVFGGRTNSKGYKQLDPHVGAIYGDSITFERCHEILNRLEAKGFASTNIVLGIGSFTYQYNTRDTFGFAIKATYGIVNGEERAIFKDPVTDDGTKKSAKGLLYVYRDSMESGKLKFKDNVTWAEEAQSLLTTVFKDGSFERVCTLAEVRETANRNI